jgi:hypothetical protein
LYTWTDCNLLKEPFGASVLKKEAAGKVGKKNTAEKPSHEKDGESAALVKG